MPGYTIYHERIPWTPARGPRPLPLGRNVRRDSRDAAYPYQRTATALTTKVWPRAIPILDQGNTGACTGNATTGAIGTGPLYTAFTAAKIPVTLNEAEADIIYSAAETIDGDGPYPPNDNGSTGQSACQAALNLGLISGYTHAAGLDDILDALQSGPVIVGVNWYDSFDTPSSSGLVTIASGATVRGGHEFLLRGLDTTAQTVNADNSWGTSWGVNGSFIIGWDTLTTLMSAQQQGDCTVPLPLGTAAPVPVPVPPKPSPSPAPPQADADDVHLWASTENWVQGHHVGSNENAARAIQSWADAKGLSTQ